MADGAVFSPDTSILVVNGAPIKGRAGGEFFNLTPSVDFTVHDGVDGLGYYVMSRRASVTMTVTLQPNAAENDTLNTFLAASRAAGGARVSILVREGRTVWSGLGLIAGQPALSFSDGARQKVWTLICANMPGTTGGHDPLPVLGA